MGLSASAVRRAALALQAAAAAGLGWMLVRCAGWPWPLALAGGAVIVSLALGLGIALAFLITTSGLGLRAGERPPVPADLLAQRVPLGPRQTLACFLHEYLAVSRMFNWLQPMASGRCFVPAQTPHTTVLMVHGYGCNHAVWLDMQPALAAAGYHCEAIDLMPVLGDIDGYARALTARLREIRARTSRAPLVLCHSMGGLVARAAQVRANEEGEEGGEALFAGLVTLGSPHHGCALARWGLGRNARQMRCGSHWLQRLDAAESPAWRARMVCVFSWHDSIAGPACTGWLAGARHIALDGLGHVSLLRHPRAVRATLDALAALR